MKYIYANTISIFILISCNLIFADTSKNIYQEPDANKYYLSQTKVLVENNENIEIWIDKKISKRELFDFNSYKINDNFEYVSAILLLKNENNDIIDKLLLERPKVYFSDKLSYLKNRKYIGVTIDYTGDAGSYNGPATKILEAKNDKICWCNYIDNSNTIKEIMLLDSLKTRWILSSRYINTILEMKCRPEVINGSKEVTFNIIYEKYSLVKDNWIYKKRIEKGFWENDDQIMEDWFEFN